MFDFHTCELFVIGGLMFMGIKALLKNFAASNPEAVDDVKKRAEAKAIDLINRILK
jgi:hypothetical protein